MAIESQLRRVLDVVGSLYRIAWEPSMDPRQAKNRREREAAEHETDAGASVVHGVVTVSDLNKSSGGKETTEP